MSPETPISPSLVQQTILPTIESPRKTKAAVPADKSDSPSPGQHDSSRAFQKIRDCTRIDMRRALCLSAAERSQLTHWVASRTSPHRIVVRSQIVLLASSELSAGRIANRLHIAPATVRLWTKRFENGGLAAITVEAPGRGRPRGASVTATLRCTSSDSGPSSEWPQRPARRRAGGRRRQHGLACVEPLQPETRYACSDYRVGHREAKFGNTLVETLGVAVLQCGVARARAGYVHRS